MADTHGFDRNRTMTREEICRRYGYDPESMPDKTPDQRDLKKSEERNRNRFFRDHFLRRNLPAVPVGKTYEVSGELFNAWVMAQSRICANDEVQASEAKSR